MAKPIFLDNDQIKSLMKKYEDSLRSARVFDGKIHIDEEIKGTSRRATIIFSQKAWIKQTTLISVFNKEVGWHGTVSRINDDTFFVEDILCYPQTVTSLTVNVDDTYTQWRDGLDDETDTKLMYQGHSHVNMAVSPSGTDMETRRRILSSLGKTGFYVFVIANKSDDLSAEIYDMRSNTMYEDQDIDIAIEGLDTFNEFLSEALSVVKEKAFPKPSYSKAAPSTPAKSATSSPPAGKSADTAVPQEETADYDDDGFFVNMYGRQNNRDVLDDPYNDFW